MLMTKRAGNENEEPKNAVHLTNQPDKANSINGLLCLSKTQTGQKTQKSRSFRNVFSRLNGGIFAFSSIIIVVIQ